MLNDVLATADTRDHAAAFLLICRPWAQQDGHDCGICTWEFVTDDLLGAAPVPVSIEQ
jgi:hypothetical protein